MMAQSLDAEQGQADRVLLPERWQPSAIPAGAATTSGDTRRFCPAACSEIDSITVVSQAFEPTEKKPKRRNLRRILKPVRRTSSRR